MLTLRPELAHSQIDLGATSFDPNAYDKAIKKGVQAPFSGFLVPRDTYLYYIKEVERAQSLDQELLSMEHLYSKESQRLPGIYPFTAGLLIGLATFLIIKK